MHDMMEEEGEDLVEEKENIKVLLQNGLSLKPKGLVLTHKKSSWKTSVFWEDMFYRTASVYGRGATLGATLEKCLLGTSFS